MKERVERLLEIDIFRQAQRPREETQKELHEHGIDAAALATEAMRITKDALVSYGVEHTAPSSVTSHRGQGPLGDFFDQLSAWMAQQFQTLSLQTAYSDTNTGSVVWRFEPSATFPYRARLVRDAAGQYWLRLSTSDTSAAKQRVRVEVEPEAPVLSFVEGEAGQFMGEVLLTEDMAKALQMGHRPVFKQVS